MKLTASAPLPDEAVEAVLQRVRTPSLWVDWVPGLVAVDDGDPWVRLRFSDPMGTWLRVEVQRSDDGVSVAMVEGTLSAMSALVRVAGGTVSFEARIESPAILPGTLRTEIVQCYPARLLTALASV